MFGYSCPTRHLRFTSVRSWPDVQNKMPLKKIKSSVSSIFPTVTKFCILCESLFHTGLCLTSEGKCGAKCKRQMFLTVDLNARPTPTVRHLETFAAFPNRNRSFRLLDSFSVLCLTARQGHGTRTAHMFSVQHEEIILVQQRRTIESILGV